MSGPCLKTQQLLTSHQCWCNEPVGHEDDSPHLCEICRTQWTGEKTLNVDGVDKVVSLTRVPTDVAYAPGSIDLNAEIGKSVAVDPCPICKDPDGVRELGELGQYVHKGCRPAWQMAAQSAVNLIDGASRLEAEFDHDHALRYVARAIATFASIGK